MEYPHLNKIGVFISQPCVTYETNLLPDVVYATPELEQFHVNETIHFMVMRSKGITMAEARKFCVQNSSNLKLIVTDKLLNNIVEFNYITLH